MYRLMLCRIVCASVIFCTAISQAHDPDSGRDDHAGRDHAHLKARLYDARGELVGDVLYVSGAFYSGGVILNVNGVFVFAGFQRMGGGFATKEALSNSELAWQYPQLMYTGENCTGTPYIYYERGAFRPSAIARNGNTATLYIAKDMRSQRIGIGSHVGLLDSEACFNGPPVWVYEGWPVESTVDLTQLHPEPLRIGQ
ncbi:hypothetical protein [Caballeronia grimmiae]|uniref:hypothetical protein n=1 Tax=Caballeronia grimmiae TaxID=1071679 RepID=UPI0038BAD160